jgi:hypothetical protein
MGNIFSELNNESDESDNNILDENKESIKKIKQNKNIVEEDNFEHETSKIKTRRKRSNLKNKSKANKKYNY